MTFQEWCKEILPIVQAGADGYDIEYKQVFDREWSEKTTVDFYAASKYRIKPKTIKVNGFDVPKPRTNPPDLCQGYFLANPTVENYVSEQCWQNDQAGRDWLARGLIHNTEEAAVAHGKAMLGIDPTKE